MKVIYKDDGSIGDVSDEGNQIEKLHKDLEIELAIRKRPEREQKILRMLREGYTYREVSKKLKVAQGDIKKAYNRLCAIIK